ncbi:MAG: ISKra4 family transposase [Gammaproteobacteria bacterium]|nr:ISKra4 family transposase [Gammaproteobacteria bacterium]
MTAYTKVDGFDEFAAAREGFEHLVGALCSADNEALEHGQVERLIEEEGREVLRRLMQGYVDLRTHSEVRVSAVTGADGQEREQFRGDRSRQLETVFGTVEVRRKGYSTRGLASVFPLDESLNLPREKYSHGLRERVVKAVVKESFDETVSAVRQNTGGHVPKRQAEQLSTVVVEDFDAYYQSRASTQAEDTDLLVMSADGKGIVVRTEDLRPATRKAAQSTCHKLKTRLSQGEKRNRKRMATVAAIYDVAPHWRSAEQIMGVEERSGDARPRPEGKRVWASLEESPEMVIERLFQEAARRDPERRRRWLVLVDGHEKQLDIVNGCIARYGGDVVVIQDFIHVLEYLWKAAYCFHPAGSQGAEQWVMERALRVLHSEASSVAAGMRRSATRQGLTPARRKAVDTCARYLLKNKARLDYAEALAHGWPIATGVIEGACRYLVKDRLEITGARWSLKGAEAILKLRALHASGDLQDYFAFHRSQERRRNYPTGYGQPCCLAA